MLEMSSKFVNGFIHIYTSENPFVHASLQSHTWNIIHTWPTTFPLHYTVQRAVQWSLQVNTKLEVKADMQVLTSLPQFPIQYYYDDYPGIRYSYLYATILKWMSRITFQFQYVPIINISKWSTAPLKLGQLKQRQQHANSTS